MNTIQLMYAGGTFGSHGTPLTPMPADKFLPKLIDLLNIKFLHQTTDVQINVLNNQIIKDSSQLSIVDFFAFYKLILESYQTGDQQFIIITGTDTLSYLGTFLAEAFAHSNISIALTASMKPLFNPSISKLIIDESSDAWANLQLAVSTCIQGKSGVRTCINGESWHSQSVQKVHSHNLYAFSGNYNHTYPASSFNENLALTRKNDWIKKRTKLLSKMQERARNCIITPIYLFPNQVDYLAQQLIQAINYAESNKDTNKYATNHNHSANIILFGFGTGNIPYSEQIANILRQANVNNHIIITSTQCVYGGVSTDYAAGSWQYKYGVMSAGNLSNEAIFARLAWSNILADNATEIKTLWQQLAQKND